MSDSSDDIDIDELDEFDTDLLDLTMPSDVSNLQNEEI